MRILPLKAKPKEIPSIPEEKTNNWHVHSLDEIVHNQVLSVFKAKLVTTNIKRELAS
jgi:hypothetical protein